MLRASFIPSRPQRQLRDLTRYRRTLTQERTREKQRAEKLLEDAQIKLSVVISDIFGKSGRAMLEALIAGQTNPHALAALAYRNMRAKTSVLQEALTGHFTEHHAFMLGMMLARIDALTTQIDTLTTRIGEAIAPFAAQVAQLDEIPGIGITAAQDLLAEIGTDMSRFPDAGHLVSWAKFAPKARQSAGRSKAASTGKGNPWLGGTLGEAAAGAARTKTFLAILGREECGHLCQVSRGFAEAGAGDAGVDVLVDDAQGLAELGWCLALAGGHERAEQPVVHLGVEDGQGLMPSGVQDVPVGVLDAGDQPSQAEPPQVVGHLPRGVGGVQQAGDQGAQALVGDAGGCQQECCRGALARAMTRGSPKRSAGAPPPVRGYGRVRDPLLGWAREDGARACTLGIQNTAG